MKTANSNMTDTELVENCVNGDEVCQNILYKKFAPTMLAVCRRYTSNIEEAEDVLHDGFIRVYIYLDKYRSDGSLEGWIRRIMVSTALNNYKKNLKSLYHADINEIEGTFEDVRISNNAKLNADVLLKMITELPKGYQLVFNLYEIEGYNHKEISEMLGVSLSTSKTQLIKARYALQQKVNRLINNENKITQR